MQRLGREFDGLTSLETRSRLAAIGAALGVRVRRRGILAPAPEHVAARGVGLAAACGCARCEALRASTGDAK